MNSSNHRENAADQELLDLMHRYLLGVLEPEELERLEREMISSPDLRDRYLKAVRIDAALHDEANRDEEPKSANPQVRWWPRILGIAAAIGLAALGYWRISPHTGPAVVIREISPPMEIATMADSRECKWQGAGEVEVGKRLTAGRMELVSGVALIEFDGGARLALQGPAGIELLGPKTARLTHGNASVRCEEGLYSFSLLTPTSTVIDLGTEFGVAVGPEGDSEVHVLDGEVEVTGALQEERQENRFLSEGETLLLSSKGNNRVLDAPTRSWVRDYSSRADRDAKAASPRVIARDRFPESSTQQDRFDLGSGWRDAWWLSTPGRKGEFRFAPMAPLVKRDDKPGLAMVVGGWLEARRFLAEPIDPTRAQTVYVGFTLYRMNPNQRDKSGKLSEATVMFRSSKDPASVLGIALSGRNYWVVLEKGGFERSDLPVSGKGPYFVVAKVEFNPWRGNRVSMTGFEQAAPVPSEEPEEWSLVTTRQLAELTAPLDVIALQVRQAPFKFGEITLGNSWQAVTNPAPEGP